MTSRTKSGGRGMGGCLVFLVVLIIVGFAGVRIWPDYHACSSMNTDLKNEVSRAGANFLENDVLMKNILQMAKRNEVNLVQEQVKITRFAGQINVAIHFVTPVDLYFYTWNMSCDLKASSFIGRL